MKITVVRLLVVAFFLLFGLFFLQLFGPNPAIVVSPRTTYLTKPLADDGLPDYAKHLLDTQSKGVTPENNAAIPFLRAMWPADLEPEDQTLVCSAIGMATPIDPGIVEPDDYQYRPGPILLPLMVALLKDEGIEPRKPVFTKEDFDRWRADWDEQRWQEEQNQQEDGGLQTAVVADEYEHLFDQVAYEASDLISRCQSQPWTAEQMPLLAEWVKQNADNFELLHLAARRPKYYCPSPALLKHPDIGLYWVLSPDLFTVRSASRALGTRALLRIGERDHIGSWEDCKAMHQLAAHVPADTLIGELVRIACKNIADNATLVLAAEPTLPDSLAREIHTYYRSQQPRRGMGQAIDFGERLFAITTILHYAGERALPNSSDYVDYGPEDIGPLTHLSVDWNDALADINSWLDRIAAAMNTSDFKKRSDLLATIESDAGAFNPQPELMAKGLISRSARSRVTSGVVASLLLPHSSAASTAEDRANASLQLMQVAAALAVYRAENDTYPESLDALVPKLLPEPPVDLFLGKPLVYTRTDNGYLLVNCGPNGKDDGGMNAERWLYKGYEVSDEEGNEAAIRKLLGEPLPESEEDDPANQYIDDYGASLSTFIEQIDPMGDDHAIRLPLPQPDWPTTPAGKSE